MVYIKDICVNLEFLYVIHKKIYIINYLRKYVIVYVYAINVKIWQICDLSNHKCHTQKNYIIIYTYI